MLAKAGILVVAAALGAGSAVAVAGCGEERGKVKFEGGTGTASTAETAPTETEPTTP